MEKPFRYVDISLCAWSDRLRFAVSWQSAVQCGRAWIYFFSAVRTNLKQLVWSIATKLLNSHSEEVSFRTSDPLLLLLGLVPVYFGEFCSYSFLCLRDLLVIKPVLFILRETCPGCLERSWNNTKACNSKRKNIIIFYYCGEQLYNPRKLASQS